MVTLPVTSLSMAKFLPLTSLRIRNTFFISVSKKSNAIFSPVKCFSGWFDESAQICHLLQISTAPRTLSIWRCCAGGMFDIGCNPPPSCAVMFCQRHRGPMTFFQPGRLACSMGLGGTDEGAKWTMSKIVDLLSCVGNCLPHINRDDRFILGSVGLQGRMRSTALLNRVVINGR